MEISFLALSLSYSYISLIVQEIDLVLPQSWLLQHKTLSLFSVSYLVSIFFFLIKIIYIERGLYTYYMYNEDTYIQRTTFIPAQMII